jgi:adenylate kinase
VLDFYPKEIIADIDANEAPASVLQKSLDLLIPAQNAHYAKVKEMPASEFDEPTP